MCVGPGLFGRPSSMHHHDMSVMLQLQGSGFRTTHARPGHDMKGRDSIVTGLFLCVSGLTRRISRFLFKAGSDGCAHQFVCKKSYACFDFSLSLPPQFGSHDPRSHGRSPNRWKVTANRGCVRTFHSFTRM